jgi:tetratricopeptide (TPR) repeat protein
MKNLAVCLFAALLAGCASAPAPQRPERLFNDHLFAAPSQRIDAADIFAVSDEMRRYLDEEIGSHARTKGRQRGLFDVLYSKGELQFEYDALMTRNAAQAFAARAGNCLSLVIMTAAFAKEMAIPVQYQSAILDESWSRSDDVNFFVGHVNVTLGNHQSHIGGRRMENDLTIDFLAPPELLGLRTRAIQEPTIVAMYMNNRAAELFSQKQLDDAYWWARAAIVADPGFVSAYNTLGVIYRRHGNPAEAQRVLAHALERDPDNAHVMSNLIPVLDELGRTTESRALATKLERIEPNAPFSYYTRGLAALRAGDFGTAREMFAREVDRQPYYHEFHFWLAVAYAGLGEKEPAARQLTLARETSTTRTDQARYAAKLERIKASNVH